MTPCPIFADQYIDDLSSSDLYKHQLSWPKWKLDFSFKRIALKEDLIYPQWFEGEWKVYSVDLNNLQQDPLIYFARFNLDYLNRVVADRDYNVKSLAKELYGNKLMDVRTDPSTINRQLIIFQDNIFLETKIIGRSQYKGDQSLFLANELSLQISHNPQVSRISRSEILSQFKRCNSFEYLSFEKDNDLICGDQWQAIYLSPGEKLDALPVHTNHYKLVLVPLHQDLS